MASGIRGVVGALVASSLFLSSTTAVAAANSVPIPVPATQISPWAALSAMSGGASASALCGAATVAAAAQTPNGCVLPTLDAPPVAQTTPPPQPVPVPPVESAGGFGLGIDPLLLALGVLAAGALIYFLVRHHHHHANSPA